MAAAVMCAVTAALSISMDRSQYFINDGFSITCPSDSWTVVRQTSDQPNPSPCAPPWAKRQGSRCRVGPTQRRDSGTYWCQDKGECTNAINITVSDRTVILESPMFPVSEGQNVTLKCSFKAEEHLDPTSSFNAAFFKNNTFVGTFPGGKMVLSSVSKADEGLYKCEHPTKAQSLESRLIVQDKERPSTTSPPSPPPPPEPTTISLYRLLFSISLFLLFTSISLCISLCIYCRWKRARVEEMKPEPEYVPMQRIRNP